MSSERAKDEGNSRFGAFVRTKRLAAGMSLRTLADRIGISHVYLAEVERGLRPPFKREKWPALCAALPGVDLRDVERQAAITRGVQLDLADAPPVYQELGLVLARRIENQDLEQTELQELLRLLRGAPDE